MQIVSAQQIRKNFRVYYGLEYSLETIHTMAKRLGFTLRTIGMKRGYTSNIYTELMRHWGEFNKLEQEIRERKKNKTNHSPKINRDYNPDKFIEPEGKIDYEWEKDEDTTHMGRFLVEGVERINNLETAIKIIETQWSSPDDYWYVKIIQRKKDNNNVVDDEGRQIFVNGKAWLDGDKYDNRIGYVIVKGNTMEEAVNSLLNATVTIFDSWVDFIGNKHVSSNNGNIGAIIDVCRAFNARAYMSSYKRSYDSFKNREPKKTGVMPSVILGLAGKTDPSSRERVFDHLTNHQKIRSNPYYLVDCDDEDEGTQNKVLSFLEKEYNIKPLNVYHTHNGIHFLIDLSKAVRQRDNTSVTTTTVMDTFAKEINYYLKSLYGNETKIRKSTKKGQENPIELEHDKPIILYSEVGVQGRNIAHPEWQKYRNYPNKELRTVKRTKKQPPKNTIPKNTKKNNNSHGSIFTLKIKNKDGKTSVFKCDASSKEDVIAALRRKFPNWSDNTIMRHVGNPDNYITEGRLMKKIITEVINEFMIKNVL